MTNVNRNVPDLDQAMCRHYDEEVCVANPVLTLTAYLDTPLDWARTHLRTVLTTFVNTVGAERVPWYLTGMSTQWLRLRPQETTQLLGDAMLHWTRNVVRNHFWLRLQDRTDAPECGFYYRELDPQQSGRAGYLQLFLPLETHPDDLLQLALEIANTGAVVSMVGGYGYSVLDGHYKATAFSAFRSYAKRYLGVDLQDPDQMAWHAHDQVPGSGWLTLVSDKLLAEMNVQRQDLDALKSHRDVVVMALPNALLLRAGDAPTVGDRNTLVFPDAYAAVARALSPHFPTLLSFWGSFQEHNDTNAWLQRFAEPGGWQ